MRKIGFPATAVLLALALVSCKEGGVVAIDQVAVERGEGGAYAISWSPAGGPGRKTVTAAKSAVTARW